MLLRFTKMHALGNDFVLLDLVSQNFRLSENKISQLADRRQGIGFDQLLTVGPPLNPDADFHYRIYNADGSEVGQCGNGVRCLARFVRDRGLTTKERLTLETNTGCIHCSFENNGNITVNMGSPRLEPENIPFLADRACVTYDLAIPLVEDHIHATGIDCSANRHGTEESIRMTVVNVGNPHAVIRVDNISTAPVKKLGSLIETHERFPERVNVGFMQVISTHEIALRVFERGVGETRACGTGACASVVAGRLQGLLDADVKVNLPGGNLQIKWAGKDSDIFMTGSTCRVFEGRFPV